MTKAMTRSGIPSLLIAAMALSMIALASPAHAQADSVLDQARAAGVVGEQADGYLGLVPGASASADVRARAEQINIRRRAVYTQRASASNVTVNEMASAVACQIFASRIGVGEHYRDENGQWRTRTDSQPVARPSFCPS